MECTKFKHKNPDPNFSIGELKVYMPSSCMAFEYQAIKDLGDYPELIKSLRDKFDEIKPIIEMNRGGKFGKYQKRTIRNMLEWEINNKFL